MKRLLTATLGLTLLGAWLIPSSAEAGPLRRLFWWMRGGTTTNVVAPATESAGDRVYSYEPSEGVAPAPRMYYNSGRTAAKATWMLPKSDPRRYD